MKPRRTGIFGGLFDPPHIAHCIIAQTVLEEFDLHTVIFVPAGNPPHKKKYSPYSVRCEMTRAAIRNNPLFQISDIERHLRGKTYTIDVVHALKDQYKGDLFLIIGSDQWEEFETWKTPNALLNTCSIIVVSRPGYDTTTLQRSTKNIFVAHCPMIDISSTMIRKKVSQNESIRYLVPSEVLKLIQKKKLYRKT